MAAIDAGVTRATHTYNGMSGMHHRTLGAIEAVLSHPDIHAELIIDEHHVHPFWGHNLIQQKGIDAVGLITGLYRTRWRSNRRMAGIRNLCAST